MPPLHKEIRIGKIINVNIYEDIFLEQLNKTQKVTTLTLHFYYRFFCKKYQIIYRAGPLRIMYLYEMTWFGLGLLFLKCHDSNLLQTIPELFGYHQFQ